MTMTATILKSGTVVGLKHDPTVKMTVNGDSDVNNANVVKWDVRGNLVREKLPLSTLVVLEKPV